MIDSATPSTGISEAEFAAIIQLHLEGRLEDAERGYRSLIGQGAAPANVYSNLATICISSGRVEEGVALLREAIQRQPPLADAHHNLGLAFQQQRKFEDAIASFREAIQINPDEYKSHHALAVALDFTGRADDAIASFQQAIRVKPDFCKAHYALGIALAKTGKLAEAAAALRQVIRLQPDKHKVYRELAKLLLDVNKPDDAIATLRDGIKRNPANRLAYLDLASILRNQVKLDEAADCLREAIQAMPESADLHNHLGVLLLDQGRLMEALDIFQKTIRLKPELAQAHSNLIYTVTAGRVFPPAELLRLTRRFEIEACGASNTSEDVHRKIGTNKKIKVAFISAEIGYHPVTYFLESYLRNYDRNRFGISLYAINPRQDDKRAEIVGLVDKITDVSAMDNDEIRRRIIADGIDILIDTSGHTVDNRLCALAQRSAPIQCHWIGSHASTGVTAVDYFIGDDEVASPEFDSHFSEKLVRLSRLWVAYTPIRDFPQPEQRSPADQLVLGCFNNVIKVREETLNLWSAVLTALPDATLMVKDIRTADDYNKNRIITFLESRGVNRARVQIVPRVQSWREHMQLYNYIDIALDTTPLSGGTTTFDALFMGTPVVALRGDWMGGRMSSSTLKALGRPEWIANDAAEYTKIVSGLASNRRWLKGCKSDLRANVLNSPLCDGKSLAAALETAFVQMVETHDAK